MSENDLEEVLCVWNRKGCYWKSMWTACRQFSRWFYHSFINLLSYINILNWSKGPQIALWSLKIFLREHVPRPCYILVFLQSTILHPCPSLLQYLLPPLKKFSDEILDWNIIDFLLAGTGGLSWSYINHGAIHIGWLPFYYKQQKAGQKEVCMEICIAIRSTLQVINLHGSGSTSESVSILLGGTGPAPNIIYVQQTHWVCNYVVQFTSKFAYTNRIATTLH